MSAYHLPELRPENYGTCDPRSVPHGMLHFVPYSETGTCPASAAFNGGTSLAELSLLSKILEELRRLHAKVNILEGRSRPTLSVKTQADASSPHTSDSNILTWDYRSLHVNFLAPTTDQGTGMLTVLGHRKQWTAASSHLEEAIPLKVVAQWILEFVRLVYQEGHSSASFSTLSS